MYESLFNYISLYSTESLSETEKELIKSIWEPKRLKKHQFFLEENKVCTYTGFILKGALRQYRVDNVGVEHIIQLAIENWWVADRDSFFNRTPSKYYIDAWETTQLLIMHRDNLDAFLKIPAVKEMFWEMNQKNHIASQKRLDDAMNLSAAGKYHNFQDQYPELIQRFPQHQIASYLGIAKETLSRLRRPSAK
ncbi:Crp/Fnr family transcriptional regulator [Foetidibacter luteolus]|uniref:Crp/Fnr family transcriptional regulator n=1 Tax=Foetidibacter luteolus TaxID=2608880 RepID=UPI00129BA24D|nr:Crp/Fnr family transcriptional regulator [Foetidibacter luteolus]